MQEKKQISALVADQLAAALKRHGVDTLFGQSLPSRLILSCEAAGIQQVVYRTENAGGAMADGFARISNQVGIVTAQNGPAATLLVPPLAEALKASIPIVALVQEVSLGETDKNAFQEFDHLRLFDSCTKWARIVRDPARAVDYLDMALTAAVTGRPGPVALMLPADLLLEECEPSPVRRSQNLGHWPLDRVVSAPNQIQEAAQLLCAAEHPLVIAGGGVHASIACDELALLQEVASLPVGHTTMGKGSIADTHELSVGLLANIMGRYSLGKYTKPLLDKADVILLIGNRTNQNGTDSWQAFPPTARLIHLDIDGTEIGRNYEALRLVGDAKLTLQALNEAMAGCGLEKRAASRTEVVQQIAEAKRSRLADTAVLRGSSQTPLRPEHLMDILQSVLTPDTIVVGDASYSSVWVTSYLDSLRSGQRFLTPRGLAGLGWGFPMALGAKIASPENPVICIVGDGGFGHCWSELEMAKRMGVAVTVIVLNNGVLGYQKDAETVKFGQYTTACHFNAVDHAAVAQACGVKGIRVDNDERFAIAVREAINSSESVLIDVLTDPEAFPPVALFDALAEG